MIMAGRELDDGTWTWNDLYAFIFAAPPGTAVFHAVEKGWTTADYLLAHVIDGVRVNNWQRTEDARRGRGAPKPFPRPADHIPQPAAGGQTSIGGQAATVMTVGDFLARRAQREQAWRDNNQSKEV